MSLEGANMCPHLLHLSKSGGNLVSLNPSVLQPSPAGLPSSRTTLLPQSKSLQNYNVQADTQVKPFAPSSSVLPEKSLVPSCSGFFRSDSAIDNRVSVGSGCSTILPCAKPSPVIIGDNTWIQKKIYLRPQHRGVHLVTDELLTSLPEITKYKVGLMNLQLLHSSASLSINENWNPEYISLGRTNEPAAVA
ncbi:uncharacterized protein LOC111706615 [Eurytemora carolleeae]|uniref:uncharacterized protein LOC111706615 n=1 Tax=Eurytemora carolleeae TaxID=1294199 RepID=UPI000C781909|nr:uncharacterized protein LOC111706615 [Eurytemora carolleeae]|eukprot:XP_023335298.1 uncharacterized protein LOC111706615 [Eurytemora affinis]